MFSKFYLYYNSLISAVISVGLIGSCIFIGIILIEFNQVMGKKRLRDSFKNSLITDWLQSFKTFKVADWITLRVMFRISLEISLAISAAVTISSIVLLGTTTSPSSSS